MQLNNQSNRLSTEASEPLSIPDKHEVLTSDQEDATPVKANYYFHTLSNMDFARDFNEFGTGCERNLCPRDF